MDHVAEWNKSSEPTTPPIEQEPEPEPVPEPEPEVQGESMKTVLDEVNSNLTEGKESTQSFLNRFLKGQEENNGSVEKVANGVVEETVENGSIEGNYIANGEPAAPISPPVTEERPLTIAEKFQLQNQIQQSTSEVAPVSGDGKEIELNDIPIHKQYQFVQKVFEGNNVRFRIIVDKINNAGDKQEVDDILNKFVLNNDSIDRKDESVVEFLTLMRSRF